MDKLKGSGKIQVTFPTVKQSSGILVKKSPAYTVSAPKIKDTLFLAVFSNFAQQFSYNNIKKCYRSALKRLELVSLLSKLLMLNFGV